MMNFMKQGIEAASDECTDGIGDHIRNVTDPDTGNQRLRDFNAYTEENTEKKGSPERSMVGIPQQKGERNE